MNTRTSRVQPQRLHDHPLRVLALAQVLDSHRVVANDTVPLLQYSRLDLWVLGQQVQTPTRVRFAAKAKQVNSFTSIVHCGYHPSEATNREALIGKQVNLRTK